MQPAAESSTADEPSSRLRRLRHVSGCVLLAVQYTMVMLMLRYTRTLEGPMYNSAVAVMLIELCKLGVCLIIICFSDHATHSRRP